MRFLIVAFLFVGIVGCKKDTCAKAADRMVECKLIVGHLIPNAGEQVFLDNANGTLRGACDAAISEEPMKSAMECAAAADSCAELAACTR